LHCRPDVWRAFLGVCCGDCEGVAVSGLVDKTTDAQLLDVLNLAFLGD
jgi:hypothetical protein